MHVNGIVQGVGFRPFVARLARSLGCAGWVLNTTQGVDIQLTAKNSVIKLFVERLKTESPSASLVLSIEVTDAISDLEHDVVSCVSEQSHDAPALAKDSTLFEIRHSQGGSSRETLVCPDLATCPDCLQELFDEGDRRYHYPFINCTNCGPRFTIINDLPYDRGKTSMASFAMCPECSHEYDEESDRRYHAQPNACFECGPSLWAVGSDELRRLSQREQDELLKSKSSARLDRQASDDLIREARERLLEGQVLAVKGLGGWHLCCDATNCDAVAALRVRKHRPTKPLALMVSSCERAAELCEVSVEEASLMQTPAHPIVLMPRLHGAFVAGNIAGELPELGIMLPSTPLQHLIIHAVDRPLVMTSGNRSGEPIVADDGDALDALSSIADWFLGNNRPIVARYDDSVARVLSNGATQMVRRARGYAPSPLFLKKECGERNLAYQGHRALDADSAAASSIVFATGPEQKSTFCFAKADRMFVSQHLGDLESLGSWRAWQEARERYAFLFDAAPRVLACDMHPEYLSSKWARKQSKISGLPLVEVQHHHAHIASVMGENALFGQVIGIALDGTGYGVDGTIWGGELLLASRTSFERKWHLPQFRLPGGAAAIKEPMRVAYALLTAAGLLNDKRFSLFVDELSGKAVLSQMIAKRINSPLTSSAGRLFDGMAALLGLCTKAGYDGEPACLLEAEAECELKDAAFDVGSSAFSAGDRMRLPANDADVLAWLLVGDEGSAPTAAGLHVRLAFAFVVKCVELREQTGINQVALSGGCMVNKLLFSLLKSELDNKGFEVFCNKELPPNDGCIAYGQAVVARACSMEG